MANSPTQSPTSSITRFRFANGRSEKKFDQLSVEEPLEIILDFPKKEEPKQDHLREQITLAVTMRTPGNDQELAAGFLFAEGIIKNKKDILEIAPDGESANPDNTLVVKISNQLTFDPDRLQRYFFTNSSCGVCGKTSMQALEMMHQPDLVPDKPFISSHVLQQLPDLLRAQQQQFANTGSVHSVAAFSSDGKLMALREDIGRHNAMDKLVGALLLDDKLSLLKTAMVLVSGRASFELVQKALMADIPFMAAIGAPSSLAVQLASRHNMTLAGFLKADSFNVYSGFDRIND